MFLSRLRTCSRVREREGERREGEREERERIDRSLVTKAIEDRDNKEEYGIRTQPSASAVLAHCLDAHHCSKAHASGDV